jgi:hypothetical protein
LNARRLGATTTTRGLHIQAERDTEWYPTGVKISDADLAALPLTRTSGTVTLHAAPRRSINFAVSPWLRKSSLTWEVRLAKQHPTIDWQSSVLLRRVPRSR